MSLSALNSGLSGLQAYSSALGSSAHNVANANTAGFVPQQLDFQEQANGGITTHIGTENSNASSQGDSGTDLASEIVQSIQFQFGFDVSAKIVKTNDEILGALINIKA